MDNEWFCTNCHRVWSIHNGKCCSKGEVVKLDLQIHGEYLIGKSNAWIDVDKEWSNNLLYKRVAGELADDQCYSASTIHNSFIERLRQMIRRQATEDASDFFVLHTVCFYCPACNEYIARQEKEFKKIEGTEVTCPICDYSFTLKKKVTKNA